MTLGENRSAMEATVDRLRTELEGLRSAMRTRAVIEQAKGLLVGRLGCTPEQAFEELSRRSQQENRKLTRVAADLVATAAPRPAARATDPDRTAGRTPSAADDSESVGPLDSVDAADTVNAAESAEDAGPPPA
ncbi:ANTAR domain-containing protein, partial [Kitasatospora cheerisanensis]|uniref:ANTAR domain-containing protein n=1 Tax=Kitasatospora cheerisanensis TaxID=81942 RepID=UPI0005641EF9